jgi:prepilin-type N-terminal cleavage/methylation domain-containing protein
MSLGSAGGRVGDERAFSLIELLITIAVLGVLAAIAIPAFLSQTQKGQDAGAKTDLRSLVGQVEECRLEHKTYKECDEKAELDGAPGVNWGGTSPQPGQSGVFSPATGDKTYYAYALSKAATNGVNHIYIWQRNDDDTVLRWCTTDNPPYSSGGCSHASW